MDILNNICVKAARVYRTLNRPILRSKVDASCELYADDSSDKPLATLKVGDLPEIRLLDLIMVIAALKVLFSAVKAVVGIFKD